MMICYYWPEIGAGVVKFKCARLTDLRGRGRVSKLGSPPPPPPPIMPARPAGESPTGTAVEAIKVSAGPSSAALPPPPPGAGENLGGYFACARRS